jgi:gephyrin
VFEGKNKLVLGLPGNPVSATVTSHLYVLPAIRKMSGYTSPLGTIVKTTVSILKCLNEQANSGLRKVVKVNQHN